jgi:hypothetical protein
MKRGLIHLSAIPSKIWSIWLIGTVLLFQTEIGIFDRCVSTWETAVECYDCEVRSLHSNFKVKGK